MFDTKEERLAAFGTIADFLYCISKNGWVLTSYRKLEEKLNLVKLINDYLISKEEK